MMGQLKGKLVLQGLCTAALLSLQAKAEGQEVCDTEDLFWDETDDTCRTCTRCSPGMQSTAETCGFGVGTQGECELCPREEYQDKHHTKDRCKRCVQCDPEVGVEVRPCAAKHNRLCGCQTGFGENPMLANTCLKCDLWPGAPLKGCEIAATTQTATTQTARLPSKPSTTRTGDLQISPKPVYNNDNAKDDNSLSDAAVISISIVCAVAVILVCIVVALIAIYRVYGLERRRRPPPVKMNNAQNNADVGNRLSDNNGNVSISNSSLKVDIPSVVISPEEVKPLMTECKEGKPTKPEDTITKNTSGLAPTTQLLTMEKWTPTVTPKGTPRGSPYVFKRSISAPCGDQSPYSDRSFSPQSSTVEEESGDQSTYSLALPEKARKDAIQYQKQMQLQKLQEDKQKARSIGAKNSLPDFVQDFNATCKLSQMLEINEDSVKNDWRNLAAAWGYSNSDITAMKEVSRRGNNMGLTLLFEKENAERYGLKNLENLLDSLEEIKREDAVQYLAQYLIQRSGETTL